MDILESCICKEPGNCKRFNAIMGPKQHSICNGTSGWPEEDRIKFIRMLETKRDRIKLNPISKLNLPGHQLKKILTKFGYFDNQCCSSCGLWLDKMNSWGIEGCKEHRKEIIDHLISQAKGRRWIDKLAAQIGGAAWLVDEAIRLAEKAA